MKLIPELRFSEFENDGEWLNEPLENVYSFLVTNSFSRAFLNYDDGNVKNIHYGDIHTKFSTQFDITKEEVPFVNKDVSLEKIKKESYCKEGDIVFADASEDLDDVGKSIEIINLNGERLLSGLHTLLARQKADKLKVGFGGFLFKSPSIRKQIKRESQGAKVFGISGTRLSQIVLAYPKNKQEQQKIASCLSSLDELIAAHNDKLTALKDHKKGLLQNLFPQEGETVPKVRFPEFKGDGAWVEMKLGEISHKIMVGIASAATHAYRNSGIILFRNQNIKEGYLDDRDILFIDEDYEKSHKNKRLKAGDLLTARTGYPGTTCVVPKKYEGTQSFTTLITRPDKSIIDSDFLCLFINSDLGQSFFEATKIGGGQKNVNAGSLIEMPIIYPPKKEQQKIASCLSAVDELITAQQEKIEQLQQHKKGLMQGLFPKIES